jgi:microcystin-dependent protein
MSKARDLATVASRSADTKPGTIAHFASAVAPAGWLECDGGSYSATAYPALFAILGTVGQSTFNVPDLRGEFIRGVDNGRGVDPGRTLRSAQGQSVAAHNHAYEGYVEGFFPTGGRNSLAAGTSAKGDADLTTASTGDTETRPRNVAMLACIKF